MLIVCEKLLCISYKLIFVFKTYIVIIKAMELNASETIKKALNSQKYLGKIPFDRKNGFKKLEKLIKNIF